ncbi:MAG: acetate--CoA ligase family protein [Bacteroidetes bacterium]|nr:acetate--CoA ligase family protein [Bacteroidota bacterium]
MKLFEHQAKKVFREAGIPTPRGVLATNIEEVKAALAEIGLPCVLKSQVLTGGRGKAGLIKVVTAEAEALAAAELLFSSEHQVKTLLIEEAVDISREIYISVTADPVEATALILASADGGVEIEVLAETSPEKIIREFVDINIGLQSYQAADIAYRLSTNPNEAKQIQKILMSLYKVFSRHDAELAEINPLFVTKSGDVVAGDGKLMIDENSMHRQPDFERTREYYDSDMEFEAAQEGIPYLQFDGDISLMCAGAGLTTTVYDLINYEGGTIANYLEFGGPNYRKAVRAMELCLRNDSKVILIVTFGTIARADVMAEGIVDAIRRLRPDRPIVVCIRGTNEEQAVKTLKEAGLDPLYDTEEAVRKAVELCRTGA